MEAAKNRAYEGPPDYRTVGRHGVFPETTHDQAERYNFLAHLNRHLAAQVLPGIERAYSTEWAPEFRRRNGRDPANRQEVRRMLEDHSTYRTWSALRRNAMEMRQQAGMSVVLQQWADLNDRARRYGETGRLHLDPKVRPPRYLTAVDHHCMPGSYYTERVANDVSGAANYDSGLFVTTGGMLGKFADGGGHGLVAFVRERRPGFAPRRILDLGCGLGHNVLPVARAFPDAQVTAVDVAAPMLRYGAARAACLGVSNVEFVQADAADLAQFRDGSFDWVGSIMFLHETSLPALRRIMAESRRLVADGGLVTHIEQPRYDASMPLFEQAMRDWDALYNNEPFWTKLHEIDLDRILVDAGFDRGNLIHAGVYAITDGEDVPDAASEDIEDYGRKPAWRVTGAEVPA